MYEVKSCRIRRRLFTRSSLVVQPPSIEQWTLFFEAFRDGT